jgi:hypothetical protein
MKLVDTSGTSDIHGAVNRCKEEVRLAVHLTPTELADELQMKRRDVISKCMEMHVPIFQGRIDKTLFISSLRRIQTDVKHQVTA